MLSLQYLLIAALSLVCLVKATPIEIEPRQTSCPPLELVFFAGTSERGLGSVGTPLGRQIASVVPGATAVAPDYDSRAEYRTTVQAGARSAESYIAGRAAACPNLKFVIGGYSKGALVVHSINLNASLKAKVSGVAVFGDPAKRPSGSLARSYDESMIPVNDRSCFFSACNSGDNFCDGGRSLAAHLAYPRDGSVGRAVSALRRCF